MMITPMEPIRESSPATSSRSSHHPTVDIKHYRLLARTKRAEPPSGASGRELTQEG
jgi:hypothetical protein